MEKHVELGCLLDLYGAFLTQRQRTVLEQTANEDCSLAEIAQMEGISRQGVRDALLRGEAQLYAMENKLGLLSLNRGLHALRKELSGLDADRIGERLDALIEISEGGHGV
ncbi:MAG: sigma factor-like helix-turn-helix DNA-binding protein [Eubacteriales bacterium]|nr:sigma factor-like helix-turn-helix DNA-binding protein [Eubacteriales bacterium]